MIDLYYWTTPNGHKVTIFLEEAGVSYKVIPINIGKGEQFKPDFLAAEFALCVAELPVLYSDAGEIATQRSAYAQRLAALSAHVERVSTPAALALRAFSADKSSRSGLELISKKQPFFRACSMSLSRWIS